MANIDWSSLWKKEDWWAVWIGFLILLLVSARIITSIPWAFPKAWIPF
jgi:hypothetical protein